MELNVVSKLVPNAQEATKVAGKGSGNDFGDMLMDVMKDLNETQQKSRDAQRSLLTGQPAVEIHDVMIAMEKASVAMQLTMQVRNKLLEAYQEISRMQV